MTNRLPLYENDHYTQAAIDLSRTAHRTLQPIFNEYIEKGYSIRDIESIILGATFEITAVSVLRRDVKDRQARKI